MDPVTIESKGKVIAHIFSKSLHAPKGIRFMNNEKESLQIGLMERPKGYHVKPHLHPHCSRTLLTTSEFLFVQNGRIRVTLFDDEWQEIDKHELSDGDSILILEGGHAIKTLEPTRMFEVKQGPYMGDSHAKVFRPNS